MPDVVRVRFAPSPTGDPHIGSIWIALFNYIFARQNSGSFVLRIEDTDRQRLVPGVTEKIYEALSWYGIAPDEGPQQGGRYGPYIQSERIEMHTRYAQELVEKGSAYYCFCTPERLEQQRRKQAAKKMPPKYDKRCAALSKEEVASRLERGESAVIRLNLPSTGSIEHIDIIRGKVTFRYDQLDDSVLLKSDGFPTYHLANVVDDHLMEISHVIRAEEWLPSVPKHLFLHRAFGWEPPKFAHMPMILGSDRSKLSKRHGATSALTFRDQGYLPDAMRNFLVLMGWHPEGDEEILSFDEVVRMFRLEDMNPAGAIFDRTKLDWMNGTHIRRMPTDELVKSLNHFWTVPEGEHPTITWKQRAVTMVKDRMKRLDEIDGLINFAFRSVWDAEQSSFDRTILVPKKGSTQHTQSSLRWVREHLAEYADAWEAAPIKERTLAAISAAGRKNIDVLWPLRVALSLRSASPDVFDILELIGKKESLRRIDVFQ